MRWRLVIAALVLAALGASARGATHYVSQIGSGSFPSGANCTGKVTTAVTSSFYSGASPGDTIYICGVVSTHFTFSTTGTSGSPITIIFDSGAALSSPNCGTSACWNFSGAYQVWNGGTPCGKGSTCANNESASPIGYTGGTGYIEANLNGTAGSACAAGTCTPTAGYSQLIGISAANVTLENLIIRNAYRHTSYSDTLGGAQDFTCVATYASNQTVLNSTFHDCSAGDNFIGTISNVKLWNNNLWNINWGFSSGGTGANCSNPTSNWSVAGNFFGNTAVWDDSNDSYHHDQFFLFADSNYTGCFSHFRIYNNWFQQPLGINDTAMMYLSGGLYRDFLVFNNLFDNGGATTGPDDALITQSTSDCPSGFQCSNSSGANYHAPTRNNTLTSAMAWYNNTIYGGGPTIAPGNQGCIGQGTQLTFVDNVSGGCNQAVYDQYSMQPFRQDYNVYGNVTSSKVFASDCCGFFTTLAAWQTILQTNLYAGGTANPETHSALTVSGSLGLGTALAPQSGSIVLSTSGINLTSVCSLDTTEGAWMNDTQYLCTDTTAANTRVGSSRPSGATPWTPGAYQSAASAAGILSASPNPVTFGSVTVGNTATPQTVTITNTGNATATGISALAVSDTTDYSIASNTCSTSLAASATCTFAVGFKPLSSGSLPATITVTYTGGGSPLIINITGSGGGGTYFNQGGYQCNDSTCGTPAATLQFKFPSPQVAGDLNVCNFGWYDATSTLTSVTSSNGNTYTPIGSVYQVGGAVASSMWSYYASGINSGNETVTATWNHGSPTAAFPEIKCGEYSGVNAVDKTAITSGTTGTAMSSPSITTTNAHDVIVGFNLVAHTTNAAEAGWTQRYLTTSGNILEDIKPGATGTFAASATQQTSGSWMMQVIAFEPGSAATPAPTLSPPASFYWTTQTVSLACVSCTEIVYTTNGTVPSVSALGVVVNGTVYSTALTVSATTNLQAIAWNSVSGSSPVTLGQYNIGAGGASTAWPLKVSANGRYLTDQNGTPYMIIGDSEWVDIAYLTPGTTGTMAQLFADRQAHGFNTVLIMAAPGDYTGATVTGAAEDGTLPFTSGSNENNYALGSPNATYWTEVQNAANLAASYNLTVVLGTLDTGINNSTNTGAIANCTAAEGNSWMKAARLAGNAGMYTFGQYLGTTFAAYKNVIFFSGDDFQTWNCTTGPGWVSPTLSDNTLIYNLMSGLANTAPSQLQTTELNETTSWSQQDTLLAPLTTLSGVYPQISVYDGSYSGYNAAPVMPCFDIEGIYDYQNILNNFSPWPGGPPPVIPSTYAYVYSLTQRMQFWWTINAGCVGGNMYGNFYVSGLSGPDGAANWQTYIDSVAASEIAYFTAFWGALPWSAMQPDQTHNVVTSATSGTYQNSTSSGNWVANNYVTTLWNPNGTVAVVYTPLGLAPTVNLSKFVGNVTAQWFDPSAGSYVSIAGSPFTNTGTQSFSTPGTNSAGAQDWVLLLQAAQVVQTLTAPTFSPVAGSYVGTQTVTLADATGAATICFTTDGSMPTATTPGTCSHGTTYSTAISVTTSQTITAIATLAGYNNSPIASAGYTISGLVGLPVIAVVGGVSPAPQTVSITSPTAGATICYTTDGSVPTAATPGTCSHGTPLANGGSVRVAGSVILQALGTEAGFVNSSVAAAVIYVGTAPPTVIILL
jgi:hypothetical protein